MKSNGMSLGYSYGVMIDRNIANDPNYWLNIEVLVTGMKNKIGANDTLYITNNGPSKAYTNATFDYKLQYLQIPVSLKLRTHEIGNFVYFGQIGLGASFLIDSKLTTSTKEQLYASGTSKHSPNSNQNDGLDFNGNASNEGIFKDNVTPLRLSMILGVGIEYRISGKTVMNTGIRFDNGFTDMFLDKKVKGINNYLGIQLGVFF